MPTQFDRVSIVGTGLIGGSLGLAMRKLGLASEVVGTARSERTRLRAVELGAVDRCVETIEAAVADADLVILATPVRHIRELLRHIGPELADGAIVTDVGSTKATIAQAAAALPQTVTFIGGHPLAGSESEGIENARADLFQGAVYALTPMADTDPAALQRLQELALAVGSRPLTVDPWVHDRMVAAVSHLPHVVAASLVEAAWMLGRGAPDTFQLASTGFGSTTRVAAGSPELWRDICLENQDAVLTAVERMIDRLNAFHRLLRAGGAAEIEAFFRDAQTHRAGICQGGRETAAPRLRIAIDGPAGAGKSTVARAAAKELHLTYVDTGAMYRAAALLAARGNVPLSDEAAVVHLAEEMTIAFEEAPEGQRCFVNGEDVTAEIRTPEISRLSSPVSAIPGVRAALTEIQRGFARRGGVVMEGRDIQTVVMPEAEVKVFLTATPEERTRRRCLELELRGTPQDFDKVLAEIRERDARDSGRDVAPLAKAPDATEILTDNLTVDEVIARIVALAREVSAA